MVIFKLRKKHIIIQAKKSLLFNRNSTWCKKTSNSLFDVTMGSYDGAGTCERVGSYLPSKFGTEYGNDIGLYRDDGLAASNNTPREIENIKKHICKTFSDHSLKITIEANKKCVNCLDIALDLKSASYKPTKQPPTINTPQHTRGNNRRLSNISSDKGPFIIHTSGGHRREIKKVYIKKLPNRFGCSNFFHPTCNIEIQDFKAAFVNLTRNDYLFLSLRFSCICY